MTPEIAGGVVMKAGCSALEKLAAVRKHAEVTKPTTESSLRRRKARTRRLTLRSVVDLAIFMGVPSVCGFRWSSFPDDSAFVPTNAHWAKHAHPQSITGLSRGMGGGDEISNVPVIVRT